MKFSPATAILSILLAAKSASGEVFSEKEVLMGGSQGATSQGRLRARAKSNKRNSGSSQGSMSNDGGLWEVDINVRNLSFMQTFSPFFVLVHNDEAEPIYTMGEPSSDALALLAELGNATLLVDYYKNRNGVMSATATGVPPAGGTPGGGSNVITVTVSDEYPLVSIAAMAVNTNDCFVALNGVKVESGMRVDVPGLDAGSEINDESCDSVPGPACVGKGNRVDSSGNGEGFVHVHRGIQGVGDFDALESANLDWRNPMMRVTVD